jgi:hypothetical protein
VNKNVIMGLILTIIFASFIVYSPPDAEMMRVFGLTVIFFGFVGLVKMFKENHVKKLKKEQKKRDS